MSNDKVRICWPDPDATCLEGGCIHCQDARPILRTTVARWARTAGQVRNRGNAETKDALKAWRYGLNHGR